MIFANRLNPYLTTDTTVIYWRTPQNQDVNVKHSLSWNSCWNLSHPELPPHPPHQQGLLCPHHDGHHRNHGLERWRSIWVNGTKLTRTIVIIRICRFAVFSNMFNWILLDDIPNKMVDYLMFL